MKKAKYTDPHILCKECGWQSWLFPVEVGCRGFPVWITLSIVGKQRRATVKALRQAVERASRWIRLNRDQENWKLSNEG